MPGGERHIFVANPFSVRDQKRCHECGSVVHSEPNLSDRWTEPEQTTDSDRLDEVEGHVGAAVDGHDRHIAVDGEVRPAVGGSGVFFS